MAGDASTTITLSYDEFGRKVAMNDPDMGQWSYHYNAFGQLIRQTDAKQQTVTMRYDVLGRMVSRVEAEGNSTWVYGDNTAAQGSIGKLLQEKGNGLTKDYRYDSLGRPVSSTTTIVGQGSFTSKIEYDNLGRVKRTSYPGSQHFYTENKYNANGFLEAVTGQRSHAEKHDYDVLQPLIKEATVLADQYLSRAESLRNLGLYYQSRIDNFTHLLAKQTIKFESGTTAGLEKNLAYSYLSAGNNTYYIQVPDTYIPVGTDVITPIIIPSEYHYRVQDDGSQQTITRIAASEFKALSAGLVDSGDKIYVLNNNSITCACRSVGHKQYIANLQSHQSLLNRVVAEGQSTGISTKTDSVLIIHGDIAVPIVSMQQSMALPAELLSHINNTKVELQAIKNLIADQSRSYQETASQLVLLAEQTLAAADHNFQFERTLDTAAAAYSDFISEENTSTITYWRAVDVDASGRISAEVYGNGIVNDYAYNQATGQLQSIHSSLLVVDAIRHLEYQYDAYQNVTLRDDLVNDIRESYDYDRLDRLTTTHVRSDLYRHVTDLNNTQSLDYNVLGNITYKSDVGAYVYGDGYGSNAGPHAVTQAGNKYYSYDANGNMTRGDGRTIQWSSFNKPTQITQNGRSATFSYGPSRARYMKVNHQGDTTLYVGRLYERLSKSSGGVDQKHYIYAAGQLVAEHIVSSAEGTQTRYLHKDALGSIDLVTDAYANVVDRRSFDSWGKLRVLPWQSNTSLGDPLYLTQLPFTNKGYTGHENVQEVNLIHMNGRMYDATLARFISADPHIQAASLSQSYNRYSYVLNNPLKYTDPSGYFFKKLFKKVKKALSKAWKNPYVRLVVGLVAAYFTAGAVAAKFGYASVGQAAVSGAVGVVSAAGAAGGFVSGLITSGGDLKSALIGGLTGAAAGFIGAQAGWNTVDRAVAHGVVGGSVSVIQGGKFGRGFVSSFFTKMVSNRIQGLVNNIGAGKEIAGAAIAAVVGGTASVLGGGKFANGAQTAAIQYLFNQAVSSPKEISRYKILANELRVEKLRIMNLSDAEFKEEFSTFYGLSKNSTSLEINMARIELNQELGGLIVGALKGSLQPDILSGPTSNLSTPGIGSSGLNSALSLLRTFRIIDQTADYYRHFDLFSVDYDCSRSGSCRVRDVYFEDQYY